MLDRLLAARLQDVEKASEIAVGIAVRVADGIADPGLSGQVNHTVSRVLGENCQKFFAVKDVHFVKCESLVGTQQRQAVVLQSDIIIGVQVVDPDHLQPAHQESMTHMEPDEPRCACDDDM